MRHYEIIYIVNPNLNDEEYHELLKKFNDIIESLKGVVIKTQEWGKQRLAYRIKKFYNGVYVLVDFCANPETTAELERNLNLDDRILKFQTVKLADKADPEELLKKEKTPEKVIEEEEQGEVSEEPTPDSKEQTEENSEDKNGEG
jgi:small subunit ribosomal protein S6